MSSIDAASVNGDAKVVALDGTDGVAVGGGVANPEKIVVHESTMRPPPTEEEACGVRLLPPLVDVRDSVPKEVPEFGMFARVDMECNSSGGLWRKERWMLNALLSIGQ
jgi:hypothetical protein